MINCTLEGEDVVDNIMATDCSALRFRGGWKGEQGFKGMV